MVPTGEYEGYANSRHTWEEPLPGQATTGLTLEQLTSSSTASDSDWSGIADEADQEN